MDDTPVSLLEAKVDEVIADYLEAERAGLAPDPTEVLARHPELADELRAFFSDRGCFAQLAQMIAPRRTPADRRKTALSPTIDAGRYVGLEPHAKGGLGEVFRAMDTELHRVVALKRLQDRRAEDASSQRRFLLEAEVTARLEHPGVVPVHSLYHDDAGRPCYTMRFIEGQTLADALHAYHNGPPDPVAFRRLLQSFIQVCETVAYAHSRGVIHRDLKPQNIMLGKFGETMVVDWGLAKVVGRSEETGVDNPETTLRPVGDSSHERTQMGSAVGTPAYMSPEQAAGRWDVITAASDVYNLGAVLYALLTGRAPLDSSNWPEMQQKIQWGDFPRPRSVKPTVPRALEAVCLRAMAMKPDERYSSARELAREIELWLADEPVGAYPEPLSERLLRWTRRRQKALIAYVISGFIALVAIAVSSWIVGAQWVEMEVARRGKEGQTQLTIDNLRGYYELSKRTARLEDQVAEAFDGFSSRLSQSPPPEAVPHDWLRKELLRSTIDFWAKMIDMDRRPNGAPGMRTKYYQIQQILCLAHMGETKQAIVDADQLSALASKDELTGDSAYHLARVYALGLEAVKADEPLTRLYTERAMALLQEAREAKYFKLAPNVKRLKHERDLVPLHSCAEFKALVLELETPAE